MVNKRSHDSANRHDDGEGVGATGAGLTVLPEPHPPYTQEAPKQVPPSPKAAGHAAVVSEHPEKEEERFGPIYKHDESAVAVEPGDEIWEIPSPHNAR
jgi:hypothetical protein